MSRIDIDKLGEEVAAQIKGAEADRAKIAPMLRKVWAELEAKRPVKASRPRARWADLFRQVAIIRREPLNEKVKTQVLESVGLITHGLPSNEAVAGRSSQRPECEES